MYISQLLIADSVGPEDQVPDRGVSVHGTGTINLVIEQVIWWELAM
jgi:hypothetical protein